MLKILAIGDVHIQPSSEGVMDSMFKKICRIHEEKKPHVIVLLGDILHCHANISSEALNIALKFIQNLVDTFTKTKIIVLIGNHDLINNQQFLSDKHAFNALKRWKNDNIVVVDTTTEIIVNTFRLIGVPYVPVGKFKEALNQINDWRKNTTCIFAHQEFYGAKMGSIKSIEGDKWKTRYPVVITGHVHDQQILDNIIYTGTPIQHGYGDEKKKTIGYFEFDKNNDYTYEKIDLKLNKKKTIRITADMFDINDIKNKIEKLHKKYAFIKLKITGSTPDFNVIKSNEQFQIMLTELTYLKIAWNSKSVATLPEDIKDYIDDIMKSAEREENEENDNEHIQTEHACTNSSSKTYHKLNISFEKILKKLIKKESKKKNIDDIYRAYKRIIEDDDE